jgi:hypothetical protein
MNTKEELSMMSIEKQLGYLQCLAGCVYNTQSLPEHIRESALDMEEVGVHYYEKLMKGKCSLKVLLETDVQSLEERIIDIILYYQSLLQKEN